jgi:hypothetical protein
MDVLRYSASQVLAGQVRKPATVTTNANIGKGKIIELISMNDQIPSEAPSASDTPAPTPPPTKSVQEQLQDLQSAIGSLTNAWTKIVGAFKTTSCSSMKLLNRMAFTKWSQKTQVIKAVGIPQRYQSDFAKQLMTTYALPQNLTSFVMSLMYAQQTTWESADTLYSPTQNSYYKVRSVYKSGDYTSQMASYFVADLQFDFSFAPDLLSIQTHKSVAGGFFDKSKEGFQKLPHNVSVENMMELSAYFQLVQAQAIEETLSEVFGVAPANPPANPPAPSSTDSGSLPSGAGGCP